MRPYFVAIATIGLIAVLCGTLWNAASAAADANPTTPVTPATVVAAADAARIAELENSVQKLRAAVEEVSANLRNEISKTLSTTLQRDSLRADVDRLTATIGDLEAGTHERSLKQKQQHETSAKHAEQIAALKAQVQRLLSEQTTASQPYNVTDYLASQGARLYKAAGDFVAQIDTASLQAWAATSWQRVSTDASAAWTEIRQHAGTSLDGAERVASSLSAKSKEITAWLRDLLGEWQAQLQLWLVRTAGLGETTARTVSFVVLVAASVVVAVLMLVLLVRIVSVVLGAIAYILCCRCLRKARVGNANNAATKKVKTPAVMAR